MLCDLLVLPLGKRHSASSRAVILGNELSLRFTADALMRSRAAIARCQAFSCSNTDASRVTASASKEVPVSCS